MKYEIKDIAGIPVIFAPMQDTMSVTIEIMCKAWSIYEEKKTSGISHFLEHLFFKWGKKYPTPESVAKALDKFWWEFNAYTWDEFAWYYVKCAPEFVPEAIDVLWDMMIDAQFPDAELEREKGVVIQEIKMYEDNPMAVALWRWQQFYFWDNSYGWPTAWTVENVAAFTKEMVIEHRNNLYTKDNLIIVVTGKITDQSIIEKQIEELFAWLAEKRKVSKPEFNHVMPSEKIWFFEKKTEQNHLVISAPGFNGNDKKKYAANVLATMLWWNMSSRLFQNIREKQGLCYYISAKHLSWEDNGVFIVRAGIDKERFEFWVEKIWEEIEKIANWDFTQEEFDAALWYTEGQLQMWIESSDDMASFIGNQYLIYNKVDTIENILAEYKKLTIEDIKNIAHMVSKEKSYLYYVK